VLQLLLIGTHCRTLLPPPLLLLLLLLLLC
jgi:hypothetical protein